MYLNMLCVVCTICVGGTSSLLALVDNEEESVKFAYS